jgi:hypothetical protein
MQQWICIMRGMFDNFDWINNTLKSTNNKIQALASEWWSSNCTLYYYLFAQDSIAITSKSNSISEHGLSNPNYHHPALMKPTS